MHHRFTNRLINESSPYLLQHAHNPVDWYAWGEEALLAARNENKVILVSIGYSACHWCHVMERESFENESVAELMNKHFINIKIDREERPDIDHIYMDAVQAMTGSGGWPLNVFLTPSAKPFFGGTYFPPVAAFNRASWTDVLRGISMSWAEKNAEIEEQAAYLIEHLEKANSFVPMENDILTGKTDRSAGIAQIDSMFAAIMNSADTEWGGFGKAPKFPQTFTIQFLFRYHYFTRNKQALRQALLSLDKMLTGGIYDHVGGGLARYSTDNEWLAPHFEKMLYDNALLVNVLCDAYQLSSEKKYETAIRKTISFVSRELLSEEGGFYAALDADSEGEEGKYYVWQKDEVVRLLGADAALFCDFFDITQPGNWEGENILRMLQPAEDFALEKGLDKDQFLQTMQQCLEKLAVERNKRIRPMLDDKILLGWNALISRAIAKAAVVLQDREYGKMAAANYAFLETHLKDSGAGEGLLHTYKNGKARYPAFLDDYANLVAALLQLYQVNFNKDYLKTSYAYCKYIIENFSDGENIFFYYTHKDQNDVIVRKKEIYDGATPSGNAIMAQNLYTLAIIFDRPDWQLRSDKMLEILHDSIVKYPGSFGIWASLMLQQQAGINEIAITGANFAAMSAGLLLNYIPNLILMASAEEDSSFPLLKGKTFRHESQLYLCKNYTCLAPFSEIDPLLRRINETNKITK